MPAINAPLDSLDGIARSVRRAQEAAMHSGAMAGYGTEAADWARQSKAHCRAALAGLEAIGATIPGIETDAPAPSSTPLHLLSTANTRRLLDLLEQAAEAGAAVDRERGNVDRDGDPTGYGETLAGMAVRLRAEVIPPFGRD